MIEDYVVGAEYEVIEVDGLPAKRAEHALVTVVPFVLVAEGTHRLTLEGRERGFMQQDNAKKEFLSVTIKKGQRYRLFRENGKPTLTEIKK